MDLITIPGLINLDFADVKTVMACMGRAVMGTGIARGENRAVEAVKNLRAEGKQAYFLHGPQASWVYVECLASTIFRRMEINGKIVSSLDPLVNALLNKYQYHENGQRITDIGYDRNGKRFKTPRKPKFIDVAKLFLEAGY